MKILKITPVIILVLFLSGCIGTEQSPRQVVLPATTPYQKQYTADITSITEITDTNMGQLYSNLPTGWYDPAQNSVKRFTDTQLGMKKAVTIYYVYDAPTEISLIASDSNMYSSESKHQINNYARAPTSKGIHRVWQVTIVYDTPLKEDLPVVANYKGGKSLRAVGIGVFSGGNIASFEIKIQDNDNTGAGYKEGYS